MNSAATIEGSDAQIRGIYEEHLQTNYAQSDRIFTFLLPAQWLFAVFCAVMISPYSWEGLSASVHTHVWAAVFLGAAITVVPVVLTIRRPGQWMTRWAVAGAQAMFSALLIHLLAGRIEAHFHVFVSLGLLACYRDRSVFIPMVVLTTVDHLVRGYLWPISVFGVEAVMIWRAAEHAAWMSFMTIGLISIVRQSQDQLWKQAELESSLMQERDLLETRVDQRTSELAESREFQQSILDSIDAHICILNSEGDIVFVNKRWKDIGNQGGIEELNVGDNYLRHCDNIPGDGGNAARQVSSAIRILAAGHIDSFATDFQYHDPQKERWLHVRLSTVQMDGERAIAVVHVDISELKTAQGRADALANLFMESPNELFVFTQDSLKFIEVNEGARENLGYSLKELKAMTPLDIKPEIEEPEFNELLQRVRDAEGNALEFETKHQRKDGSLYTASISLNAATFQGQAVYVAFVADVTDRVQLENRLRQAQKLESMGQLAAGIAHEINTPMQCVFSNVEFLQKAFNRVLEVTDRFVEVLDSSDVDWEKERKDLQEIREKCRYDYVRKQTPMALDEATEASKRVISIVRAMKVMSHPGTVEKVPSDLNELIEDAATITRNRWKYVSEMKMDLDESLGSIHVLPAEMSQVLINMMVNAADSIAEKLGPEPESPGMITVSTRRTKSGVEIEISDTGIGISAELKQRIFDPFFTTKDVGKGTGQGLAITYDVVVNKHGGNIELESTEGEGATFFLTIPDSSVPVVTGMPIVDAGLPLDDTVAR